MVYLAFGVALEDFMPIHIRLQDKNTCFAQQKDITMVKAETMIFLDVSYTALYSMFGLLYESI